MTGKYILYHKNMNTPVHQVFFRLAVSFFAGLLLLSFSVFSQEKVIDKVVAVVGNHIILQSEIEAQYYQMLVQGYSPTSGIRCQILEEMLFQKLLLNQAKLDSIEVTEKQVETELDRRLKYYIEEIGSVEKLEEYFRKPLIEMKNDLKDVIKEQLLANEARNKITEKIKITPSKVKAFYEKIPQDSMPFIDTELELQQIIKHPVVSEEAKLLVKQSLLDYKERVRKGDDFSTLAIMYSEDQGTATKGGELGFVGRGDLVPEFAAVAFNLKEDELSRIVETEFGFHIIQMIEKRGDLINVRHILLKPKITSNDMRKAKNYLDSINNILKHDTLTFDEAALKFSDDEETRLNGGIIINPATGTSRFKANEINPTDYYHIQNLKPGEFSQSIESTDEKGKKVYKIIYLKTKSKPHRANLREDYQLIQNMATEDERQNTLFKWIQDKLESTYIHVDEEYRNCAFSYADWIKAK